jgi:hypothetical protein
LVQLEVPEKGIRHSAVTLIPCSDLKIGHWTRINPSTLHHEVLAYTSQTRQCISWFIRSSGLSFKIEVPFGVISRAQLVDVKAPQLVTLVLELKSVPLFFVQQPDLTMRPGETLADLRRRIGIAPHLPLPNIGAAPGEWVASNDWTQNQQASRVLRHELTGPRTSILPGVRAFPKEFNLFPDDGPLSSQSENSINGLSDILGRYGSEPYERDSASPSNWWNDPHQLPSAHTPSSYSGYESSSQYSNVSSASYASSAYASASQSAHTPASSTHGLDLTDLNLNHDPNPGIVQPVPIHANVRPSISSLADAQRAQTIPITQQALSQHNSVQVPATAPPHNLGDLGGFGQFSSSDELSRALLSQQALAAGSQGMPQDFNYSQANNPILFPGFHDPNSLTSGDSLPQAGMGQGGIGSQQAGMQNAASFSNFGLDFNPYGNQPLNRSTTNGAVNIPFEVDASYHGTAIPGSTINTYPQLQQSQSQGFDEQLFLQSVVNDQTYPSMGSFNSDNFSGANNYAMNPFTANQQAQPQLVPQNQTQAQNLAANSQPNSRRSSVYGYQ